MDNYESEVKRYCKMIDMVFNGYRMPISISPMFNIDNNKLILKILEKQSNKLIVNVNTMDLINNHELITPDMFLKTFYEAIKEACENNDSIQMCFSQFGDDLSYGDIYNLIEKLPKMIICASDEIDGILIIFRQYYQLMSKMPNPDYLYYLFKNKLLPNQYKVCYIFSGDFEFFNQHVFKAKYRYFKDEDRLSINVTRDFEFLKTIYIGHNISLDLDIYRFPVGLEIVGISKKLDIWRGLYNLNVEIEMENHLIEITLQLNNVDLIIVYKNNEYFPNGTFLLDLK